ncbi:MAG TPA: hypothetical protein VFN59_09830 [Acidimicrobiales bacterium]|nr:hypothetical protein [Acidimicrobiales bacterium]
MGDRLEDRAIVTYAHDLDADLVVIRGEMVGGPRSDVCPTRSLGASCTRRSSSTPPRRTFVGPRDLRP